MPMNYSKELGFQPVEMPNVYLGSKGIIAGEDAAQMQYLVYGACPHPGYVTAFDTDAELQKWIDTLPQKDRIAEGLQKMALAQQAYEKDPFTAMTDQQVTVKSIRTKMEELSAKTGLDVNSTELFLQATVDANLFAGPIFRSAQLFEHYNCTGRRLDIGSWTWYPNLGWFGFDDIISSVRVHYHSLLVLFEHPNFNPDRGQLRFFFGGPFWSNEYNMDPSFNDRASSAYCIPY